MGKAKVFFILIVLILALLVYFSVAKPVFAEDISVKDFFAFLGNFLDNPFGVLDEKNDSTIDADGAYEDFGGILFFGVILAVMIIVGLLIIFFLKRNQ